MKLRVQLLRDLGPALSPHSAFLLLQGVETLSLRIERHSANAQALAEWLEQRDEVAAVHYAGLPSSPWYEAGRTYLPRGAGAIVSFELRDGVEAGKRFVDAVRLFSHLANIGDVRSLIIHPASTTHSQLDQRQLAATGTSPGWCGCPSASRTSTTSRPTWRPGSVRRRARPEHRSAAVPGPPPAGLRGLAGGGPARRRQWTAHPEPLVLEAGGELPGVRLAFETWGRLAPDRSNAVLVLHALTGDSHVAGEAGPGHPTPGWWDGLVGPGRALDTDRWFVVAPNVLGGCQGSTGPSSRGPSGRRWGGDFPS